MKTKLLAAGIALCILLALITPRVKAAGSVYFTGINDKLIPLSDQTIPKFYGGELYLPYTVFTYNAEDTGIGVFCAASSDQNSILLYTSGKRLKFDVASATIFDKNNVQYSYSPRVANGTVYLPAGLVCSYFGLTLAIISAEPVPVIRVKNASAVYNDPTFAGAFKDEMISAYNAYLGITESSDPSVSPSTSASPGGEQTYEKVNVFLSFYDLNTGQLALLLDILDTSEYKCAFFAAADEIAEKADLIRRAAGSGHTIGIWLDTGTYDEYQLASDVLFEAAKVKTLFVSSSGDAVQNARETAESKGLIFWDATGAYDETSELSLNIIANRLSSPLRRGESLCFTCSERISTVIPAIFSYLAENKYNVCRITETSKPPM